MSKPKVRLSEHQDSYEFYNTFRPNPVANRIGHAAMGLLFQPDIHFADGAERAIDSALSWGTRLILASNHVNDKDQYVIASLAQRAAVLRPMRGKTFIPAKESLFQNSLLRWGIDQMGAVPTFRKKDTKMPGDQAQLPSNIQDSVTNALLEMSVDRISRGDHMAIFPEGTRNKDDPRNLQRVSYGIGRILCGLPRLCSVAVMPVGLFYGQGDELDARRPTVYIGKPYADINNGSVEAATNQVKCQMTQSLQNAVAYFEDSKL